MRDNPPSFYIAVDLEKSGLKWADVEKYGWYELPLIGDPSEELKRILGFSSYQGHNLAREASAILVIPYLDEKGQNIFNRVKIYGIDGIRYLSPTKDKAPPALYILPSDYKKLKSPKTKIFLTEGEKKVIKLVKTLENFDDPCAVIGISGITMWHVSEGWDAVPVHGRDVFLVFDADSENNKDVRREEIKLYCWLRDRGAQVKSLVWQKEKGKGIDDYLAVVSDPVETLKCLLADSLNPLEKYKDRPYSEIIEAFKKVEINSLTRKTIAKEIKEYVNDAKALKTTSIEKDIAPKAEQRKTQADLLIELGLKEVDTFFTDQKGVAFAKFRVNDHFEVWPVRGKMFKSWLCGLYFKATGKGTNTDALRSALNTLESKALFEGLRHETFNRVAQYDDAIFYDLTNEKWQAVKITKDGWDVVDDPSVFFKRYGHQKPQVLPSENCDIKLLLPFLNFQSEDDKILFLVSLVSCFLPHIPHPIPVLYGPQGSAKSTLFKLMKAILDPSITPLLSMPKDFNELVQRLDHHWFCAFDNLTNLTDWQSDALSRAVTGEGHCKRQLYTDDEDVIFAYKRCIGLNGINCIATKPDLLDRSILFETTRIGREKRKEERKLWGDFYDVLPKILGGCFHAISKAMSIFYSVKLYELERMADFTRWGFAIAEALHIGGDKFLEVYCQNITRQHLEVIEANPVALALREFIYKQKEWQGMPSELLAELKKEAEDLRLDTKDRAWPKQPNSLVRKLNTLKVNLQQTGIDYCHKARTRKGAYIHLRVREKTYTTYIPTQMQKNQGFLGVDMGVDKKTIPTPIPTPRKHRADEENVGGVGNVDNFPTLEVSETKKEGEGEDDSLII